MRASSGVIAIREIAAGELVYGGRFVATRPACRRAGRPAGAGR
jgi:hypothetical protein